MCIRDSGGIDPYSIELLDGRSIAEAYGDNKGIREHKIDEGDGIIPSNYQDKYDELIESGEIAENHLFDLENEGFKRGEEAWELAEKEWIAEEENIQLRDNKSLQIDHAVETQLDLLTNSFEDNNPTLNNLTEDQQTDFWEDYYGEEGDFKLGKIDGKTPAQWKRKFEIEARYAIAIAQNKGRSIGNIAMNLSVADKVADPTPKKIDGALQQQYDFAKLEADVDHSAEDTSNVTSFLGNAWGGFGINVQTTMEGAREVLEREGYADDDITELFGRSNGFVSYNNDGTQMVFINPKRANPETPIHEFGHLWNTVMQENAPEIFNTLVDKLQQEAPDVYADCLLYTSPSPRDRTRSRMPSSA